MLLRIKKLRRFLDERIREALHRREEAAEAEARAGAAGRLAAYQEVRDEMVGERLDTGDLEREEAPEEARADEEAPPPD